jgi:hypothetical protein
MGVNNLLDGAKHVGNLGDVGFDGTFFFFCLLSDRAVLDKQSVKFPAG